MIITAPDNPFVMDLDKYTVFLAGGITNCSNWQAEVAAKLDREDVLIFNPRRHFYSEGVEEEQIEWEYRYLRQSDIILFYFAPETLCPITLYEYGYWVDRRDSFGCGPKIYVCCHPDYKRINDVRIQTRLCCPYTEVYTNLEDMTDEISRILED